jgi:hypothetical protein
MHNDFSYCQHPGKSVKLALWNCWKLIQKFGWHRLWFIGMIKIIYLKTPVQNSPTQRLCMPNSMQKYKSPENQQTRFPHLLGEFFISWNAKLVQCSQMLTSIPTSTHALPSPRGLAAFPSLLSFTSGYFVSLLIKWEWYYPPLYEGQWNKPIKIIHVKIKNFKGPCKYGKYIIMKTE